MIEVKTNHPIEIALKIIFKRLKDDFILKYIFY